MRTKLATRGEAVIDGITGIVGIPSVVSSYHRHRYLGKPGQSDIERSWTFVGKYLRIALEDFEDETKDVPSIWKTESETSRPKPRK